MPKTPEAAARQSIDRQLDQSGWPVQDHRQINISAAPGEREDLEEFVECYRPGKRHLRKPTWDAEKSLEGRWRSFDYDELVKRDKVNLDIFWLKDKSLEDSGDLPAPAVLAPEIADDLQTALEQFQAIAEKVKA
jgi:type I restriction enzyme M protein